jgi:hypothetical protein
MGAHRKLRFLAPAGTLLAAAASCQTPAAKPVFDLTDVRVSPRSVWTNKLGNTLQGGFPYLATSFSTPSPALRSRTSQH